MGLRSRIPKPRLLRWHCGTAVSSQDSLLQMLNRKLQYKVILQVCQQLELIGFLVCVFKSCIGPGLDFVVQELFGGRIPVSNF